MEITSLKNQWRAFILRSALKTNNWQRSLKSFLVCHTWKARPKPFIQNMSKHITSCRRPTKPVTKAKHCSLNVHDVHTSSQYRKGGKVKHFTPIDQREEKVAMRFLWHSPIPGHMTHLWNRKDLPLCPFHYLCIHQNIMKFYSSTGLTVWIVFPSQYSSSFIFLLSNDSANNMI